MNNYLPELPTDAIALIKTYLLDLQKNICSNLESIDTKAKFCEDEWARPEGGGGITRALAGGDVFEKAGVNFSHVYGASLPQSANLSRPALDGFSFNALGVSLVIHPDNPYVPTTHANVRFFLAEKEGETPIWWFGGGFDLTPFYGFEEDCIHWHQVAKNACDPFGDNIYARFKKWCDDYFFIKHRNEARGVGGLFFDDYNEHSFMHSFKLMQSIGNSFSSAYAPIVEKRKSTSYTNEQKQFQLYRRGRYVEYNLVYDRGTLFGLQSNGRTESILMSMPPNVTWQYNWSPKPNSLEAELYTKFLPVRDWLC